MVGFTLTLQDRVAEMLAGVTLVLWFFDRAVERSRGI